MSASFHLSVQRQPRIKTNNDWFLLIKSRLNNCMLKQLAENVLDSAFFPCLTEVSFSSLKEFKRHLNQT